MDKYVVVIGGSNIDYIAKSFNPLISKDSNPGKLNISFGGVGRNVVENISRLGVKTKFLTVIGDDAYGKLLNKQLEKLGVEVIKPEVKNINTSSYIAICDNEGDMNIGVCDNDVISLINKVFLDKNKDIINNADYVVIDTNLNKETLEYIIKTFKNKKLICDAISVSKANKIVNYLDSLYLLKVNELEYEVVKGYKKPLNLVISNGSKNVELINDSKQTFNVDKKDTIVNTTGAGDALLSGIICGLYNSKSFAQSIEFGIKIASLTLDYSGACNPELSNIKI